MATTLKLLSAGAVKPGLVKVLEEFRRESGDEVQVAFATAPEIRKRLTGGETTDVLIAPPDLLQDLLNRGGITLGEAIVVGRIGVGVMTRDDLPGPDLATVDGFKHSLLNADSIVYNQASTGVYLEKLFERLEIDAELCTKTTRYPDFAAVLEHVRKGHGMEIGLGAITVIIENANQGIKFAGPLPAEIQHHTAYAAAVIGPGENKEAALALVRYLAGAAAKSIFAAAGIECAMDGTNEPRRVR